jgi:hypothetical protein
VSLTVSESAVVVPMLALSSCVMPKELSSVTSSGDKEEVRVMSALFSSVVMMRVSF